MEVMFTGKFGIVVGFKESDFSLGLETPRICDFRSVGLGRVECDCNSRDDELESLSESEGIMTRS